MDNTQNFSAPGRVEIGGNHTDHQCGRVLTAAIDLETTAKAKANGTNIIRIQNAQFGAEKIDISTTDAREKEKGTPASIVRGVAAWFKTNGYAIGGFDAEISSTVPVGEGLSGSAAYAVLIGNVFKGLFGSNISKIEIARAGQYAENTHFGKPCGLMDQAASSFGGLNLIDFETPERPIITPLSADFSGCSLCVVSTGGSHEDLTPDYAAVTTEMKSIAAYFGKEFLREVPEDEFYSSIGLLRRLSDRAVLRAIHFFGENERVRKQAAALEQGDMRLFYELVIESGRSSQTWLQNAYSPSNPALQGLALAMALSEKTLSGNGAWKLHGGGFAGTILAFVPYELKEKYNSQMTAVFGENSCRFLNIRK